MDPFPADTEELTGFTERYVTNILFILLSVEHTIRLNKFSYSLNGSFISGRPYNHSK